MPITTENTTIHKIKNDLNGNPRIVIGWLALLQCEAMRQWDEEKCKDGEYDARFKRKGLSYDLACSIGKQVGFKRYKPIGGGMVTQTFCYTETLDALQAACKAFVVDNTDNDCLTQHVLLQGDQSYLTEGKFKTLHACIKKEKQVTRLTLRIVEDWLRGLPTACTVEFMDYEQEQMCKGCGLIGWNSNMYWRYAAKVVLAYKG